MRSSGNMPPRVAVMTLGCAKNLVDSEHIGSLLQAAGVEVVTDPTEAPVVVVNTCGFIDAAKEESIKAVLDVGQLKEVGSLRRLIVTGCLSQRFRGALRELLPEADVLIGVDPVGTAQAALWALGVQSGLPEYCNLRSFRLTPARWSYLRIAEGCDNRCAYCAIPQIRGPLRSRPLDEIVEEAGGLLEDGVFELNVIAQDTTAYGADSGEPRLHELLRRICALPHDKWVRLLYTHPAHFYPELIAVLAAEEPICPYLDIPLQHASDSVLKRMGRKVRRAEMERLIETLRRRIPDLTLRTTLMVGFPGETDGDFEELLEFVRAVRFDRLGAFAYSREDGTPAAALPGQVPQKVRQARHDELMRVQQEIAFALAAGRAGERTQVLVEEIGEEEGVTGMGRGLHEAPDVDPVIIVDHGRGLRVGDLIEVEIVGSLDYDCVARVFEKLKDDER
jgi:ribosomal protein S12 methylthiotransferase